MHQHHSGHQHLHAELEKRQEAGPGTVIQYVYETASKTFDGPVGGYSTLNPPPVNPTPASQPQQQDTPSSNDSNNESPNSNPSANANSDSSRSNNAANSNQNDSQRQQEQAQQQAAQVAAANSETAAAVAAAAPSSKEAAQPTQTAETKPSTSKISTPAKATDTNNKPSAAATSKSQAATTPSSDITATSSIDIASTPTSVISQLPATSSLKPSAPSSSGGMSGGAKTGIAFGVILGIAAIAALVFLLYRRKKKQQDEAYQQANDEKAVAFGNGPARSQSTASTATTATAPRLSLRPVTQFLPDLAARGKAAAAAGGISGSDPGAAAMSENRGNGKEDPFGDHAGQRPQRLSDKPVLPIQSNTTENPFGNHAEALAPASLEPNGYAPAPLRIRTPSPSAATAAAIGAGALAEAGAVGVANHDKRDNAPKALDLSPNRPIAPSTQSPVISEFSQTSASSGGPPPSNVHRVQLDFKPSMDDELELKAGALVRLLHEYDDGWALCIRLDRSQQGVAPRTCLSARPVKPRPAPGARGPGHRVPPPGMKNGPPRPASPAMHGRGPQRPASPAGGRGSPSPYGRQPRPIGPNSPQQGSMSPGPYGGGPPRSMSPGPYGGGPKSRRSDIPTLAGKRRSNSAGEVQTRRNSPPGPSPMNPNMQRVAMREQATAHPDRPASPTVGRKPVPGQAM
ncbi:MAG: hypothetical protein Q9217_005884 [Psora testacea]